MKMKIKKENRYDTNRPRSWHLRKYSKYKKRLSMILICIMQHLSNISSSIHENIKQHWGENTFIPIHIFIPTPLLKSEQVFDKSPSFKRPLQMKLLTDESLRINRFSPDITDSDMKDANEETNIIESDEEIDDI